MEREAGVLKDRIEIAASNGASATRRNGFDVIRMNSSKATAIQACTASALALSVTGRLVPNSATKAPKNARIDTHSIIEPSWLPQDAGQPVDQRHRRIGILVDIEHREVGGDVALGERQKRDSHEDKLRQRRRRGDAHEHRMFVRVPTIGHDALDQRQAERQHQGVMAELRDHLFAPVTGIAARCE